MPPGGRSAAGCGCPETLADVEVAAPFALAVEAGRHLAVRGDAERADERRDRPGDVPLKCSVPSRVVPLGPGVWRKIFVV